MKMISYCPICGAGPFPAPIPEEELRCSFWICYCCGCEYGYDDNSNHRERWLSQGAPWFNEKRKPEQWDLEEQLKHIDPTWNVR